MPKKKETFQDILGEIVIARNMAEQTGDAELVKELNEELEELDRAYLEALNNFVGEQIKKDKKNK